SGQGDLTAGVCACHDSQSTLVRAHAALCAKLRGRLHGPYGPCTPANTGLGHAVAYDGRMQRKFTHQLLTSDIHACFAEFVALLEAHGFETDGANVQSTRDVELIF